MAGRDAAETRVASSRVGHNTSRFQHVMTPYRRPHGMAWRRAALRGMTFPF